MTTHDWQPWTPGRYQLGEGARWHESRLYFVDLLQGILYGCHPNRARHPWRELDLDMPLGAVAPVAGRPGQWIAAVGTGVALLRPGCQPHWLARVPAAAGHRLRMNDGACDSAGRFWATSMAVDAARGVGALHRIDPDGSAHRVLTGLTVPNGPAFDATGTTLYLADSAHGTITAYRVHSFSGRLGPARTLVRLAPEEGRPDGMTVDDRGLLWVALWGAGRVHCYNARGLLKAVLAVPAANVSSVAFGGGRMYVTTALHQLAAPGPLAGAVLARPCTVTAPAAAPFRPHLP
ncbi:SMP-30/gluconolactonase/LRE family protein [Streptomyces sp. BE20]|uniref:SMP-30/gluconolactonase/LRE family protein n=1 Tax=Streptomyces sp. BE20 TaxID=3002525 RepID=UPI002E76C467|nr:SMP-30/gluconolactonase/LRE family protein [Streptomyces sp. BE20]MEE1823665.1 SMP-30/gluconolactonase/LRE family protein [Streptomyces sp. BE20]